MRSRCHLTASLSTTATGFGTRSAVVHMVGVFFAFLGAGFADMSAKLAYISRVNTATGHERNGRVADLSAVPVEPDAIHHHHYILFAQTGFGAGIAANSAGLAGFNTILILLGS